MSSTLIALSIGAVIIQQLLVLFRLCLQWKTLDVAGKQDFWVKLAGLTLGIVFALVTGLNIVPEGALPNVISPLVLVILSGIAVGFGLDFALGLAKLGSGLQQVVAAQVVAAQARAASAFALAAHG